MIKRNRKLSNKKALLSNWSVQDPPLLLSVSILSLSPRWMELITKFLSRGSRDSMLDRCCGTKKICGFSVFGLEEKEREREREKGKWKISLNELRNFVYLNDSILSSLYSHIRFANRLDTLFLLSYRRSSKSRDEGRLFQSCLNDALIILERSFP